MKTTDQMTPEEALAKYKSKVTITAQAEWDRWPEASGMREHLFELASAAGVSVAQVVHDLDNAPIDCTGGRW